MFTKGQKVWYYNGHGIKTAKFEKLLDDSDIIEMRDDSQRNWQCYAIKDKVFATEEECKNAFEARSGVWALIDNSDDFISPIALVEGDLEQVKAYIKHVYNIKSEGKDVNMFYSLDYMSVAISNRILFVQNLIAKGYIDDREETINAYRLDHKPVTLSDLLVTK